VRLLPFRRGVCTGLLALLAGSPALAQGILSEPLVFGDGRVTLGGDASATFACSTAAGACGDDTGFFNYTDYDHSTLRALRIDLAAAVKANRHISILGEVRGENGDRPRAYGLYVRLRPWEKRAFDIQIGRVPPTFGAFTRRTYPTDNPLIGYPLAYQYVTSLRSDAIPATTDELLRMRARGWLSSFSVGNPRPAVGLPVASIFTWDTGVQVHGATEKLDVAAAVTAGSLSHPLVADDNAGKQVAARVAFRPLTGLVVGVSGARAPFLSRSAWESSGSAIDNGHMVQNAFGTDLEYSQGYYLVRLETILSNWTLPVAGRPNNEQTLGALSTSLEGRYKIHPRLYAAVRYDHLGFSSVTGRTQTAEWDAPVTRIEAGGGFSILRNLQVKASVQHNARDGGRISRLTFVATQLVFWF